MTVAIIGSTGLATFALITYPYVGQSFGFTDTESGLFLGASIHGVPQAIAAGFVVSDEAGQVATLVKLMRVACLLPIALLISRIATQETRSEILPRFAKITRFPIPPFLVAFVTLAMIASVYKIPKPLLNSADDLAAYLILLAVCAIGLSTSPKSFKLFETRQFVVLGILTGFVFCSAQWRFEFLSTARCKGPDFRFI